MDAIAMKQPEAAEIFNVGGREFMKNAKGDLVAVANIKPADKLQDETVRKIIGYALDLSAQIDRFRSHTMVDLGSFDALLEQEYGAKIGGKKGNRTYQTFDGLMQVKVQVADQNLAEAETTRKIWERRVAALRNQSLDPDRLDERARALLNYARKEDIIVFTPTR